MLRLCIFEPNYATLCTNKYLIELINFRRTAKLVVSVNSKFLEKVYLNETTKYIYITTTSDVSICYCFVFIPITFTCSIVQNNNQ